jgi:DNA primase
LPAVPLIEEQSVEAVRLAADLVELVRGQVQLTRKGGRWMGRCPFHDERTASFCLIPPENRSYYCFGCGASGDAVTWMREREGAGSFAEAIEALAERFGVTLRYERGSPQEEAERQAADRRADLLERAAAFYAECLWRLPEAAQAREYLTGRGFDEALLRRFRVGWAPRGGAVLAGRALRQGFSREQLADAGLARLRGGTAHDFFQGRITFPIADPRGRVQGFGARTLDPNERAKYVNSPESPSFRKRRLLFGLHLARAAAGTGGWIAVAEGYTDVLALARSGVEAAVACMGTSLTAEQLRALARSAPEVRLCFDADEAGQKAAWRTVEAASGIPIRLSAVQLPNGQDPGDLVASQDGQITLRRAVEAPKPLLACLIDFRVTRALDVTERERALRDITMLLQRVPESVDKDEGVRVAASGLGLSRVMEDRLRESVSQRQGTAEPLPALARQHLTREERLERRLLVLAVALPDHAPRYLAELPPGGLSSEEHRKAAALLAAGTPPEDWPERLATLGAHLRAEAAVADATVEELREAVLRVQLPSLEREAERRRREGDDAGRLQVLELIRRARAAASGGRG